MPTTTSLGRTIAISVILAGPFSAAICQAQAPIQKADPGSPEAAAASLWQAISKSCPVQGEASPSLFLRNYNPGSLMEYRDGMKGLSPAKLTKADELNGIRYKGYANLGGAAFRTFDPSEGRWSKWQVGLYGDSEVWRRGLSRPMDHEPTSGWPFYWTFVIQKTDDRWTFRMITTTGPGYGLAQDSFYHLIKGEPLDLATLSGAAPQLSCAELTSQNPGGAMRPKPKGDALEDNLSDSLSVSEVRPFAEMPEQAGPLLRRHVSWAYSEAWLKDTLDTRAGWLESPPKFFHFEFIPAGTRYKAVIYDGVPLMFRNATVVQLESGRVGLLGKSLPPQGIPTSLIKTPAVPITPVDTPRQVNPKDGLIYRFLQPGVVPLPPARASAPSQELAISKGFWLGQTEVTQEAYERVMGKNPSQFRGPKLPVEMVTWTEAQNYCQAIGMRLPTDLQWEYAAAFQKPLPNNTLVGIDGLEDAAWLNTNGDSRTHEVARKFPNRWGFYDMLGNVAEFVADVEVRLHPGIQSDPAKMTSAGMRLMRGGSWQNSGAWSYGRMDGRWGFVGFRCAGEVSRR